MVERRKKQWREFGRRQRDELAGHIENLSPDAIANALTAVASNARIEIRCSMDMKTEIEKVSGRYGLTITAYLLRLHELAAEKLGKI